MTKVGEEGESLWEVRQEPGTRNVGGVGMEARRRRAV